MSCIPVNGLPRRRRNLPVLEHNLLDPFDFIPQSPERRDYLTEGAIPTTLPPSLIRSPLAREFLQTLPPPTSPGWPDVGNRSILDDVQMEYVDLQREDVCSPAQIMNEAWGRLRNTSARALTEEGGSFLVDSSMGEIENEEIDNISGGCIGEEGGSFLLENSGMDYSMEGAVGGELAENPYTTENQQGALIVALTERCDNPLPRLRALRAGLGPLTNLIPPALPAAQDCSLIGDENISFPEEVCTPSPRRQAAIRDEERQREEEAREAQRRLEDLANDPRNYYEAHNVQNYPYREYRDQQMVCVPDGSANFLDDVSMNMSASPTRGQLVTNPFIPPCDTEQITRNARERLAQIQAGTIEPGSRPNIQQMAMLNAPLEEPAIPITQEQLQAAATMRVSRLLNPRPPTPDISFIGGVFHELDDSSIPNINIPNRAQSSPQRVCPTHSQSFTYPRSSALRARMNQSLPTHFRGQSAVTNFGNVIQNVSVPEFQSICDSNASGGQSMPSMGIDDVSANLYSSSGTYESSSYQSATIPPEFQNVMGPLILPTLPDSNRSMLDDEGCDFDNVLDISQIEGETHDTVQVQGPQRSPWRIQIRLLAPSGEAPSESQPSTNVSPRAARPSGLAGPSGIARPSGIGRPSGICRPSGISRPSGIAGPSGISRPSSIAGPSVIGRPSGISRPSGIRRPSGISGQSGISRPSGIAGPSDIAGRCDITATNSVAGLSAPARPSGVARSSGIARTSRLPGASIARPGVKSQPINQQGADVCPPSQPPSRIQQSCPAVTRAASQTNMRRPSQTNLIQNQRPAFNRQQSQAAIRRPSQTSLRPTQSSTRVSGSGRPAICPPRPQPQPPAACPMPQPSTNVVARRPRPVQRESISRRAPQSSVPRSLAGKPLY